MHGCAGIQCPLSWFKWLQRARLVAELIAKLIARGEMVAMTATAEMVAR